MPTDGKVLMEFYATWCPACRAFKPEYDKVARFLASQPAGANRVVALRLDCAVDPDVCGAYQVAAYPTMFTGTAADLAAVNVAGLTKFDYGKYSRNAMGVVKFVAESFKLDLTFVEVPVAEKPLDTKQPGRGVTKVAVDLQWTNPDVQLATVQLFEAIAAQDILHSKPEQRVALTQLLQVWAATHPVPSCKTGATDAIKKLDTVWPEGKAAVKAELQGLKVCGDCAGASLCTGAGHTDAMAALAGKSTSSAAAAHPEPLNWVACKGSKPEQRGFTCALWLLFHTTAARLADADVPLFMASQRGFAYQFFQCEVCKRHYERVSDSAEAKAVKDRRGAVLWLWRAHNEVNGRLAKIEAKYGHSSTGDAAFPKVQWPTKSACPQCRLPTLEKKADERGGADGGRRTGEAQAQTDEVQWNEEEVFRFLMKWYGGEPGSGNPHDAAAGGPAAAAAALAAAAADEEAIAQLQQGTPGSPTQQQQQQQQQQHCRHPASCWQ
ncbi:hypothetical protein OEZ86_007138 [Tetradesmus obliquus]|nr:hypothetical protein OEZ86_007138 [Tetradesmus obliquus]